MKKNIKIAISGAHSQGKTTIVDALQNLPEFKDFKFVTGITRDLEKLGVPINEKGTDVTQQFIMAKHYQYAQIKTDCVLDRCVLDGLAYTTCFRSKIPSWVWNYFITMFSNLIKKYDYIFYVEPELPLVSELPPNHPCRTFVELRKIPRTAWKYLYYAEDFGAWARTINSESADALEQSSRLVIPIVNEKGELVGAQGRALSITGDRNARKSARYITIKTEGQEHKGWFGLDRVDTGTIYVVEGPLDSLFIPNCVAMIGLSDALNVPSHLKSRSLVYLIDNEPRNEAVVTTIGKLLDQDKKVCIWPDHIKHKDLNDMIMGGMTEKVLLQTIKENTVSGLTGKIKFNNWKKI